MTRFWDRCSYVCWRVGIVVCGSSNIDVIVWSIVQMCAVYIVSNVDWNQVVPYNNDSTASRLLSEVKHYLAQLVLRWGTTLESWEYYFSLFFLFVFVTCPSHLKFTHREWYMRVVFACFVYVCWYLMKKSLSFEIRPHLCVKCNYSSIQGTSISHLNGWIYCANVQYV